METGTHPGGGSCSGTHGFFSRRKAIYVANPEAGTVSVVSVASGKVTKSYHIGPDVHGLDMGDDGKTLFVSSKKAETLSAVDIASGTVHSIPLAPAPYHLNAIHGTGKVYVSSRKRPVIWVIDQHSLKLVATIALPAGEGHQIAVVQ